MADAMVEAGRRDDTFGAPARGARMPITLRDYNAFCASLPATTFVEQWGDAQVWKVGGKMFGCAWFEKGHHPGITFKVSDIGWEVLKDAPGCRGAPYHAARRVVPLLRPVMGLWEDSQISRITR
jgi:YjbR